MESIKQGKLAKDQVRAKIKVPCKTGLNVLCATHWSEHFRNLRSTVVVRHKSEEADGKSVLSLLALDAAWQGEMEIEFSGEDAKQAAASFQKAMKEINMEGQ